MSSNATQKLADKFKNFPGVGPRTALRFVFYLLGKSKEDVEDLTKSILELKEKITICSFCFNPFEKEDADLCPICQDETRNKTLLCLVEKETDLNSIEKTRKYKGIYFILGGTVSALKKEDIKKLRISELEERIKNPKEFGVETKFEEIILATNATSEGQATALYLERFLKQFEIKITRLGRGLPTGGELEYADEETLASALEGRK